MSEVDEAKLLKQVNMSGFPFQLGVQDLVEKTLDEHRWGVLPPEHPWKNSETHRVGYIDIVLERPMQGYDAYAIIECKRIGDGGTLVFLKPTPHYTQGEAYVLLSDRDQGEVHGWRSLRFSPETYVSSFCAVWGQSDKQTPMLERISAELLDSVESFADMDTSFPKRSDDFQVKITPGRAIYFPVIVTNAELFAHLFYPRRIDLYKGEAGPDAGEFEKVPYIRFQKSVFTRFPSGASPSTMREVNRDSQRTVFVVQAPHLPGFLKKITGS